MVNYKENIITAFNKLKNYCEENDYKGWDPYDGLNSRIFRVLPLLSKSKIVRLAWIQFFRRSPLNFRKFFVVKKELNPKGIALFISGYCNLLKLESFDQEEIRQKLIRLSDLLVNLKTSGYSGACWGYNFEWQSRAFYFKKFTPTVVATSYAANALLDVFEITGGEQYLETAISSKNFILKDLKRTAGSNGSFAFSYSPFDQTSVFNASLLGAKLLSRIYSYTGEKELSEIANKAVRYCVDFQNDDGSWYYSTLPHHQWIDSFHTGFNLECIAEYSKFTGDSSFTEAFHKGMEYYLNNFFDSKGRSKYYNKILYPIDIHAPAQLVVTLAHSGLLEKNRDMVDHVIFWTIKNMQSPKGFFYYQKQKYFTNKISYIRWSQAWMFYGLSNYLVNIQ